MENVSANASEALDKAFASVGIEDDAQKAEAPNEILSKAESAFDEMISERAVKANDKFEAATAETKDPRLKAEREANAAITEAINKHVGSAEADAEHSVAWAESSDLLDEIDELSPGQSPEELVSRFINLHIGFQKDREGTAEMLLRESLSSPTVVGAKKQKPTDPIDKALAEAERREKWRPAIAKLREHGIDFSAALHAAVNWQKELRADAVGAVAKLRALYGAPITEAHAKEQEYQKFESAVAGEISGRVGAMVESGNLPLMSDPGFQNRVAQIIEGSQITGNSPEEILHVAYHLASHELATEAAERSAAEARAKISAKASMSITGSGQAPSRGNAPAKSIDQALDRAFATVGA